MGSFTSSLPLLFLAPSLLQVRGVESFLDMVRLAFPSSENSPSDSPQEAPPAVPADGASAPKAADDQTPLPHVYTGQDHDEDADDYDPNRKEGRGNWEHPHMFHERQFVNDDAVYPAGMAQ